MKKIAYVLIFALLVPYLFVTQPTVASAKATYRGAYSNLVDAKSRKEVKKALLDAGLSKKNVNAWLSDVKDYNKTIKNTGLVKKGFKKLSTKNNVCLVKKLKNKKKYYFYITAGEKKQLSETDSNPSKVVSKKMKTYVRTTVFAGDSITEGLTYEGGFAHMPIGGKKRTIAYRGLNTVTFHTKRVFHGRTGLQKLIAAKPYRVYMMLGMNEIHYQKISNMLSEYRDMLEAIKQSCPDTDIIVCAISPVTRAEKARHPGFWQRPVFNRKLKKLAKKMSVTYLDYTDFLKDSKGYLKATYATGDGYHWKPPAYAKFGKILAKYDRQRDGRGGK